MDKQYTVQELNDVDQKTSEKSQKIFNIDLIHEIEKVMKSKEAKTVKAYSKQK